MVGWEKRTGEGLGGWKWVQRVFPLLYQEQGQVRTHFHMQKKYERERERERERETDRQTDRQTDTHTHTERKLQKRQTVARQLATPGRQVVSKTLGTEFILNKKGRKEGRKASRREIQGNNEWQQGR